MGGNEYRLSYHECREVLRARLADRAPGRIQLLSGPRQVGKTTLLLELADGASGSAIYAAADAPEATLPGFWDRLGTSSSAAGRMLSDPLARGRVIGDRA
jgi:AAA+ ATPase superfamily predicted ATPase